MRQIINKSIIPALILLGAFQMANGYKHELSHFSPGQYNLVMGELDLCGDGVFTLQEQGSDLALGAYHVFRTADEADAIEEDNCTYRFTNQSVSSDNQTRLTYEEKLACNNGAEERYHLVKTAIVKPHRIILFVKQKGEGEHNYRCVWARQKSARR